MGEPIVACRFETASFPFRTCAHSCAFAIVEMFSSVRLQLLVIGAFPFRATHVAQERYACKTARK
jgi:hypothetical protein